jgi:hypothetical protein
MTLHAFEPDGRYHKKVCTYYDPKREFLTPGGGLPLAATDSGRTRVLGELFDGELRLWSEAGESPV